MMVPGTFFSDKKLSGENDSGAKGTQGIEAGSPAAAERRYAQNRLNIRP
jgi:hypothetical protein